jgi:7-cyano-7-deazaguanine reductase
MSKDIKTTPSPFTGDYGGGARIDIPDFTHQKTDGGHPWFAQVQIEYVPREKVLDMDSVAEYMDGWRDQSSVPDDVAKTIAKELSEACEPMAMTVSASYRGRGGVQMNVQAKWLHPEARQPQQRIMTPGNA